MAEEAVVKPLTREDIQAIMTETVNTAVNGLDARMKKDFTKRFSGIEGQLTQTLESLSPKRLAKMAAKALRKKNAGEGEVEETEVAKTPEEKAAKKAAAAADGIIKEKKRDKEKDPWAKQKQRENDDRIAALELKNTESANRADKLELDSAVTEAMGDFKFATPSARAVAFRTMRDMAARNEDGAIVIKHQGDEHELVKFTREYVPRELDFTLAREDVGGSGARKAGGSKSGVLDIDELDNPNISNERRAEIGKAVALRLT